MFQKNQNNELQKSLLALAPFYLLSFSLYVGFGIGLIIALLLVFLVPVIYLFRNLVPPSQQLSFVIILSASAILIVSMFLDVEVYSFTDKIGLFLPLLLINSLVLSVNESTFTMSDFKSAMSNVFYIAIAVLFFFVIFGLSRELLSDFSILSYPSGCFLLVGFLFAGINFFNIKKKSL